ncbi:MAG: tetratricopeptide repeat protein [Methylobacter sp.]
MLPTIIQTLEVTLMNVWNFLSSEENQNTLKFIGAGLAALALGGWTIYTYWYDKDKDSSTPSQSITAHNHGIAVGNITATANGRGNAIVNLYQADQAQIEKATDALTKQLEFMRLDNQDKQDQIKALTETVNALAKRQNEPDVKDALTQLGEGQTEAAKAIFKQIFDSKASEAAASALHLGALAFLNNTLEALRWYRRAVELDPKNVDGWNLLGQLYRRTGQLGEAEEAYRKMLGISEPDKNKGAIAIANTNLGNLYIDRGDPIQAEALYKKALSIHKALGDKVGMAHNYGSLGIVEVASGDLDQAEAMFNKEALTINRDLDRKEGMASDYGNLGNVYMRRNDLDQAEAMYKMALEIAEAMKLKDIMAIQYSNLRYVYQIRGDLDQAEAMFRKSLTVDRKP